MGRPAICPVACLCMNYFFLLFFVGIGHFCVGPEEWASVYRCVFMVCKCVLKAGYVYLDNTGGVLVGDLSICGGWVQIILHYAICFWWIM